MSRKRQKRKRPKDSELGTRRIGPVQIVDEDGQERTVDLISSTIYITFEPLKTGQYPVPPEVMEQFQTLYYQAQSQPEAAIPELLAVMERYPDHARFCNLPCSAYSQLGQLAKAEALARRNYELHPDYLFARVNLATILMSHGDFDAAGEIFNFQFHPGLLYPERRRFHISEFMALQSVAVQYHSGIGAFEVAEDHLDQMHRIAPDDPATLRCEALLDDAETADRLRRLRLVFDSQ